jgi:hypothetical protein
MNRRLIMAGLFATFALFAAAGCGSGGVSSVAAPSSTPFAYPAATTAPLGYAASTADVSVGSLQAVIQVPATLSGNGYMAIAGSLSAPSGFAPLTAGTPLGYAVFSTNSAVKFDLYPTFMVTPLEIPPANEHFYVAFATNDPSFGIAGWVQPVSTATTSGETFVLTGQFISSPITLSPTYQYVFCIYETST